MPQFVLAVDGREAEITQARELFVEDRLTLDEFEAIVDRSLKRN